MTQRVCVVCRNFEEERVLPRMARALRDGLGWGLGAAPDPAADVVYWLGYFEGSGVRSQGPGGRGQLEAGYFTHREEAPPDGPKTRLYDEVARRVDLRVAMCRRYGLPLSELGATIIAPLPVEERFVIRAARSGDRPERGGRNGRGGRPIVGVSGYTYGNQRKGEDLVRGLVASKVGSGCEWWASGRGWPVTTRAYTWAEMPAFYQGLDVLVCPSRVEGGPLPVLEALACGVRVVVPQGVGILDEIGWRTKDEGRTTNDVPGIFRYERGSLAGLIEALGRAVELGARDDGEREGLRAAVAGHSVAGFVEAHRVGFAGLGSAGAGGRGTKDEGRRTDGEASGPVAAQVRGARSTRGIYCVAFGAPARAMASRMMLSAQRFMPEVPICLCAASRIGPEAVFVEQPDSDVGGRRAKLLVDVVTPAEWETVLYLDADTEVVAPIYPYFEWVEDGWELVICQDIQSAETLVGYERKANQAEVVETLRVVGTPQTLQYNGGAWAFRRCARTARFFARWRAEWERWAQRDQGALLRALHAEPLRVWVLGNEWNTFPKFQPGLQTAGLLHWPGEARRWEGALPGRIDGAGAWAAVQRFEGQRRGR